MKCLDDYNKAIEAIKAEFGEDCLDGEICDCREHSWCDYDYQVSWDITEGDAMYMYSAEKRRYSTYLKSKCGGYVGISLSDNGVNIFAIFDVTKEVK